ncbi:hypothetical protein HNY73_009820 [Argiope bruennichi]|uniref:Uncharacterized protein n=1 Tax=Argiope bruennichi TaxID=94029 RepID=A0A8T0FDG9_ARGBR|nr:hypothetical protein HNY73_009820 [Argiope bruennichi]
MESKETPKDEEIQPKSRTSKRAGRMKSLSVQQKSSSEQKSLEGTGTLKSEWSKRESTFIESAEAEGNPRDILNSRVEELEQQLKETEERYKQLTEETRCAKELYEAEKGECEDVVFVARRNVKRLVNQILERQQRKRELALSIEKADQDAKTEERQRSQQRALEEETLTRNVVLLQTKLLILEGKRYERDRLVKKIQEAEKEVSALDKRHEEAMLKAREEMRAKYERLHATLVPCVRALSESVWELSRAQRFASLSERQRSIVETQGRYRKVVQLSLQLRDKKKKLREQRDALHREMQVEVSLAKALAARAEVARQEILTAVGKMHHETIEEDDREPVVNRREEFEALIKELENEVFHKKDIKKELKLIAKDQVKYKRTLDEEEKKKKMLREKLLSMAQVAEMVLGRKAKRRTWSSIHKGSPRSGSKRQPQRIP